MSQVTVPNSDLFPLFECKVCLQYPSPPFYQCMHGHVTCNFCLSQVTHCPYCRAPKASYRNLFMEEMAKKVSFPCKYQSFGCQEVVPFAQREAHEDTCSHKVYFCPHRQAYACTWRGSIADLKAHMLEHGNTHEVERDPGKHAYGGFTISLPSDFLNRKMNPLTRLARYDRQLFVVCAHALSLAGPGTGRAAIKPLSHYSVVVQLAGNHQTSNQYGYRVISHDDDTRIAFSGPVKSIDVDREDLLNKDQCFHLRVQVAMMLKKPDNTLPVEVQVYRRN